MEEERNQNQSVVSGEEGREVEVKDRGLFDFMGKKEEKEKEKIEEEDLVAGMEKVRVDEVEDKKEEEKKEGFLEKLHRSHSSSSSSSSSSDEEEGGEGENKEKKKKKEKGRLKEKIKEKLGGGDKEEEHKGEEDQKEKVHVVAQEEFVEAVPAYDDDTAVTVEVVEGTVKVDGAPEGGEKKGFLEKIKEKLPGHKKPSEEAAAAAAAPTAETAAECAKESNDTVVDANEGSKENKKGFLGKIMEKLPGYNKGGEEKEKETEKTSACN